MLSRTDPALLIKLFEQEVPEIYDGTVMIRGAVREAGDRAKVAVFSRERDVDPVGACVGMKGTRVQSIIRELRGEKIDIVEWSEDPIAFVTNALSPAKVQRVSIVDDRERVMEVVVEDKQLSLAIGKKGQNVRLAAKLTGWRIDIKSEEEKRREVEAQFEGLEAAPAAEDGATPTRRPPTPGTAPRRRRATRRPLPYTLAGIGEKTVRKLVEAGFDHARGRRRRRPPSSCRRSRASAARPPRRFWPRRAASEPARAGGRTLSTDASDRGQPLATVRIYKVAELLGTTSQEVTALLKRDHGIEVKSASSTIEEVVARQFVERLARQRNIALPTRRHVRRDAGRPRARRARRRRRRPPSRPSRRRPPLPPPRLVKTAKPAAQPPEGDGAAAACRDRCARGRAARPPRSKRRRPNLSRRRSPKPRPPQMPSAPRRSRPPQTAADRRRAGAAGAAVAAAAAAPARQACADAGPRRAADAAAAHRRAAADDADAAAADAAGAARGAAAGAKPGLRHRRRPGPPVSAGAGAAGRTARGRRSRRAPGRRAAAPAVSGPASPADAGRAAAAAVAAGSTAAAGHAAAPRRSIRSGPGMPQRPPMRAGRLRPSGRRTASRPHAAPGVAAACRPRRRRSRAPSRSPKA